MTKLRTARHCGVSTTFFQSLIPYLQSNVVSFPVLEIMGHRLQDEPQQFRRRIPAGHYGLYVALFSQELRKERHPVGTEKSGFLVVYAPEGARLFAPEFVISRANQRIHNDIRTLRSVAKDLLSAVAVVKPRYSLGQFCQLRAFSTSAALRRKKQNHTYLSENVPVTPLDNVELTLNVEDEHFKESLLASLLSKVVSIFTHHTDSAELNTIYPLFQSLRRHDIDLPSVHEYNIVLKSICQRALDSERTLQNIELKLTTLLTVFQDLLDACARNPALLPNAETYKTIFPCIFDGVIHTLELSTEPHVTAHKHTECLNKATEYLLVGSDLLLSIKNKDELDMEQLLPRLCACLLALPHMITKDLCALAVSYSSTRSPEYRFYQHLITLAQHFARSDTLAMDKKQIYGFVSGVYATYKEQLQLVPALAAGEFDVYRALVEALVASGNLPVASKFIDQILHEFRDLMASGKTIKSLEISALLSTYLEALMSSERPEDLLTSFTLINKFCQVAYLPELSASVYNNMINRLVKRYGQLEFEKRSSSGDATSALAEQQVDVYDKIWWLYNYVVVRKDFQPTGHKKSNLTKQISCRDTLLSLSLDLGDHLNIARLIKEILVKDHLIGDWNVSKKLYQYLQNGSVAHGNDYYQNVLWSVVEQQARHFSDDSRELNALLSEHVDFLLFDDPRTFGRVLNLMMVFNAFQKFDLLTDNAYGLMSVSSYLMSVVPKRLLSDAETVKVLQYQACLVNEFENPDHCYTELSPELRNLKTYSASFFSLVFSNVTSGSQLTTEILQAASTMDMTCSSGSGVISPANFELDVLAQLKLNFEHGLELFLTYFNQGYCFTAETWNALMTQNFAMDVLEKEHFFLIRDFVARLFLSSSAAAHLTSLVALNNDKVTIKVVQTLVKEGRNELLGNDDVLCAIVAHATLTDNKYFLKVLADNVDHIYLLNSRVAWVTELFRKFNASCMSQTVVSFVDTHASLLSELDIRHETASELISVVTDAFFNENMTERASLLFETLFVGRANSSVLVQSDKLLGCLFKYYIASGAHDTILRKYCKLKGRSAELDLLFQFSELLRSVHTPEAQPSAYRIDSERALALQMLSAHDLVAMKKLLENHALVVANRANFFDLMIITLTKAASLVGPSSYGRVVARFESVIKLCKVLKLKELNARSLSKIIRLLATTKSRHLLNIIFNKYMIDNKVLSTFNFYFLRVRVASAHEAHLLLEEFVSALELVGDQLNLKAIQTYKSNTVA